MKIKTPLAIAVAAVFASAGVAHADDASDLKAKMDALQKQVDALKAQIAEDAARARAVLL